MKASRETLQPDWSVKYIVALCFHRHSRVVPSVLKSSFVLPLRLPHWPLECGSLLPPSFAGSLLPATPEQARRAKAAARRGGRHSKALRARKLLRAKSRKMHSPSSVVRRAKVLTCSPAWYILGSGSGRLVTA